MRYLYLVAILILCTVHASSAQDYIVTLANEVEHGKVTYAPSEGNKIFFKADEEKKAKEYNVMQIRGYYQNGLFYIPKFWVRHDRHIFMPSFRDGDDSVKFKKVTKLDVVVTGQINYYHTIEKVNSNSFHGPSVDRVDINVMDIKNNPVYIQVVNASDLANLVKDHKELYDRVLNMQREVVEDETQSLYKQLLAMSIESNRRKDELTRKQIEQVIKEYNAWHDFRYAAREE